MKKSLNFSNKKMAKHTIITIVIFAIIIALYIELNILIDKFNISDIDLTESKLYSITDNTKERISSINKKVKIQIINFNEYLYASNISNSVNVIKKYTDINSNITVEETNSNDYGIPCITVSCDNNIEIISLDDLYTYEYSTDTYTEEDFDVTEELITNAILNVTLEEKNKVYMYITHSSYKENITACFSVLNNKIKEELNDIYYLDLSEAENIPGDCSCLIIPAIKEDITEQEKEKIINYINKGGNILLMQEAYGILNVDVPNFKEILNLYGFSISDGVILENSSDNMISGIPEYIVPEINYNSTIGKNLDKNSKISLIDAGKIEFKDEETLKQLNVSYEIISQVSNTAYYRSDLSNKEYMKSDSDEEASNAIVSALIKKQIDENNYSELIVFSNSVFATNAIEVQDSNGNSSVINLIYIPDILNKEKISRSSAININNNQEILENSIKYLSNNTDSLILRKKYYNNIPTLNLLKSSTIVELLFGLPMIIIFIGYIVWRMRRNKR